MARPLVFIGFSFLSTQLVALYLSDEMKTVFAVILLVFFVFATILIRVKPKSDSGKRVYTLSVAFIAALISISAQISHSASLAELNKKYDDISCKAIMQLLDEPEKQYDKFYYTVMVKEMELEGKREEFVEFKVLLSVQSPLAADVYDIVETEITLNGFKSERGLSVQNHYFSKNIIMRASKKASDRYTVTEAQTKPALALFEEASRYLSRQIDLVLPEDEAALTQAMLLGNRRNIREEINSSFNIVGASHILSLSGMHMSIIAAFILAVLKAVGVPVKIRSLLAAICIITFVVFTGFQASALRSGIMIIIFLMAQVFDKESDALNSLGAAVFIMCGLNPMLAADIGFLLSALSTLGIVTMERKFRKLFLKPFQKHQRIAKYVMPVAVSSSITISAIAFTFPVTISLFGSFSLIAPISNLLLSIPCAMLLYISFILAIVMCIPVLESLSPLFVMLTGLSAKLVIFIARGLSRLNFVHIYIGSPEGLLTIACILLFAFFCFVLPRPKNIRVISIICMVMIIAAPVTKSIKYNDCVTIGIASFGAMTVVVFQGGEAAVVQADGYRTDVGLQMLRRNNISRLSFMMINGDSREAADSTDKILSAYQAQRVMINGRKKLERKIEKYSPEPIKNDMRVEILEGIFADITGSGAWLTFTANGKKVYIEKNISLGADADILITDNSSRVVSPFTVITYPEIIKAGRVGGLVLPAEGEGIIYIDIFKSGEISIRRAVV